MVTIKEIAQKCNVSVTTVSNILNGKGKASDKTISAVLKAVEEMGYQPNYMARGLRSNKSGMIGIIAEDIAQFSTPNIIESIMEYCENKGYRTIVQNLRLYARWKDKWYDREMDYYSILEPALKELSSMKVDGIIYIAGHARVISWFSEHCDVPAVMAYGYSGTEKVPSVVIDDETAAYDMTKYLLEMGHRKIGVLGGRNDNIHTQKRIWGYQKALFEKKVLFDPGLVYYGAWDREDGYKAAEYLLGKGVTVIFSMSDHMAGGVYDYLEEKELCVAEDVSVAGFDDWEIASYFSPKLTTMKIPLVEIGYKSAETLFELIEEKEWTKEKEISMPCAIKIRKSVKRLAEQEE